MTVFLDWPLGEIVDPIFQKDGIKYVNLTQGKLKFIIALLLRIYYRQLF